MSLMQEMGSRALTLGVPLSVHLDLTYRCNEHCVHCYLDHEDHGEMNTAEIKDVLDQLAAAGVFFLVFSGGEIFLRTDLFELIEHARSLMFCVKLKTNGFMIGDQEADRLSSLHLDCVQVSIYSHRPEVHDGITQLPESLERIGCGYPAPARTRRESHYCQCLDAAESGGLCGCQDAGPATGCRVHDRSDYHSEDER